MSRIKYIIAAVIGLLLIYPAAQVLANGDHEKVTICHNVDHNPVEITVDQHAVDESGTDHTQHIEKGKDIWGSCPTPETTVPPTTEPETTTTTTEPPVTTVPPTTEAPVVTTTTVPEPTTAAPTTTEAPETPPSAPLPVAECPDGWIQVKAIYCEPETPWEPVPPVEVIETPTITPSAPAPAPVLALPETL